MFNDTATISDIRVQLESLDKTISQFGRGSSYIESAVDIGNNGNGFLGYYGIFDDKVAALLEQDPRVDVYEDVKVTLPAYGRSKKMLKMASKYSGNLEEDNDFSFNSDSTVSDPLTEPRDFDIDFERLKSLYSDDGHYDYEVGVSYENLKVSQMQQHPPRPKPQASSRPRRQPQTRPQPKAQPKPPPKQQQQQQQQQPRPQQRRPQPGRPLPGRPQPPKPQPKPQQPQRSQQSTTIPAHMLTQEKTTQWGLHRISSQKNTVSPGVAKIIKPYEFMIPQYDTVAYVVDSGIRITHKDFGGRAVWGYNAIDNINEDMNGHGSHVAGTIGANKWGVSKRTLLVAVKAFGEEDCVSVGTYLHAVNWAINDYIAKGHDRAVINMSVGVPRGFEPFDRLVRHAIKVGMPVAIAAGNDGRDACNYSPSRMGNHPGAITAAASSKDDRLVRRFAGWMSRGSNFGECVTVFAPGMNIESVSHQSDTGTDIMSGTSMAAPHVAGLMAYFQSISDQLLTPMQLDYLITHANQGTMRGRLKNSPNRLIYNGL
ncbi:peptidase S8/S53 domain-containing protein [Yarrowia lipolytica]|uniref:YALI0B22990p n=3 Tax=Yarrowia lipolytica TaxID=4952 RepID=Q6CDL6_YARLI|nr:YALI0B22990p [Yarrowia lipolytica CLIB122]KAB8283488.1 peptidase S8/S53 domain-containing protein [Yarrowia lipolytica]KAE8173279.1 peptidase S8/S53 domain-containing protein [Yarrowia lipolytica]KAJ8052862.1 peptidase S8/S53 domain-containing protein [Yarrowia lipolytica]RDW24348.1 peptidase S8/S53 domain-containing protein [Yarrowia lipolytica]RDW35725.1 peptidase S8/S53 domain-containing protein [Yarrowia lipolytica]|eukprot:XP_501246.1 YALI0B22990p [Yarrowia lipolytica CLIB122]